MGVSEVLLCPYRLEHIMVNSKNSKFNSASRFTDTEADRMK